MKQKYIILIAFIALFTGGMVAIQNVSAQEQGPNILVNSGFEEGHYSQGGLSEITVPNGWKMHWLDGQAFPLIHEDLVANRPETVVWNATGGIPVGEEMLWRDGIYTFKIFKGWAPMYAALSQDVTGLEVGRQYRIIAPVFTDIYDWDGKKVYPWDASHGRVRLGASPVGTGWLDEAGINYSPFFNSAYGQYQSYIYDFTATQSDMTIWVEMVASYPHVNNGFFTDIITMHALGSAPVAPVAPQQPAGPTWTPAPTPTPRADGAVVHIVGGADSFWSLAIQYADTLGMAPADALTHIQELNGNPQFIFTGQELMIVAPGAEPAPEPTPEEAATPEGEVEATPEGEADAEATATPIAVAIASDTEAAEATVCIAAYNDMDQDGMKGETEALLANVIFTISKTDGIVATYVSDGVNEPYCFEELPADTYQVQFDPPANYIATSPTNWAVSLSDGVFISADFGAREADAAEVAMARANDSSNAADMAAENVEPIITPVPESTDTADEGGFMDNMGGIAIGIAVVLALLAGAGVMLLRRS